MGKMMSAVRGSMTVAVIALGLSVAGSAAARDEVNPISCVPDPGNISAVTCSIGTGSSPSTFLGAFASDNGGQGGWTEFYRDDDGDWWVEHHADGGTTVGWDADDFGGNYITGPKLGFGSKEGSYANKPKPSLQGTVKKGPKRSYAAAKAAASTKTATLGSIVAPTSATSGSGSTPVEITMPGSGQCKANIVVRRDGQFVSSTGIVPVSFPSKRTVALPQAEGQYTISLHGRDGCLGQNATANVKVAPARRISFGGLVGKR